MSNKKIQVPAELLRTLHQEARRANELISYARAAVAALTVADFDNAPCRKDVAGVLIWGSAVLNDYGAGVGFFLTEAVVDLQHVMDELENYAPAQAEGVSHE